MLEPGTFEAGGATHDVELGSFEVPMNRAAPGSGTITLRFVRFPSTAPDPGSPIVYLAGGPGGSGIGTARGRRFPLFQALREIADVIAFDQRGTGESGPAEMRCTPAPEAPLDRIFEPEAAAASLRAAVRDCIAELGERGIDIRGFNSEESADDLEDLRKALGAKKLTLWGISYGTHLSLATARRHPESIDRMILAGIEGPDHTFKLPSNIQANLERLGRMIADDATYARLMPDFPGAVRAIRDRLNESPARVELLPGQTVTTNGWDLQKMLASPMGSQSGMRRMPAIVNAMAAGEYFDLARWAYGNRQERRLFPMSIAMDCASWSTAERLARIAREANETVLGATIDWPMPSICDVEGLPRLADDFRGPLRSEIPTLFISGTMDGRTPPGNAEEIAAGFSSHQHLVIGNAAHSDDLFLSSPQILESMLAHLRGQRIAAERIELPAWEFAAPYEKSLEREMLTWLTTRGYEATVAHYMELRRRHAGDYVYHFDEGRLNILGYDLLAADRVDLAIDVFKLNTEAYPEGFNTWDSLGEAYMTRGDRELAIANYEKSLELNPANGNAVQMLRRLRAEKEPSSGD